jgi:hypothetical protein
MRRALRIAALTGALVALGAAAGVPGQAQRSASSASLGVDCDSHFVKITHIDVGGTARPGHGRSQQQALKHYLPQAGVRVPAAEFSRRSGDLFEHRRGGRAKATAFLERVGEDWRVTTVTACAGDDAP